MEIFTLFLKPQNWKNQNLAAHNTSKYHLLFCILFIPSWQKVWLHGSKQNQSCLKIHDTYLLLATSLLIPKTLTPPKTQNPKPHKTLNPKPSSWQNSYPFFVFFWSNRPSESRLVVCEGNPFPLFLKNPKTLFKWKFLALTLWPKVCVQLVCLRFVYRKPSLAFLWWGLSPHQCWFLLHRANPDMNQGYVPW